ncbi:MAG: S41 family peptidase [Marinifilum sp.]|jgi:hypothetical protein|nr:S41 family peptidase [Marinifilum sp.]
MNINKIKSSLIPILLFVFCGCCSLEVFSQDFNFVDLNPKSILTKEQLKEDKEILKTYHPNPFNSFPENEWDSLINVISTELPSVPIKETEKRLIRRRLLDRVTFEDPHVRFMPVLGHKKNKTIKSKNIKALPFSLVSISDTMIVDKSLHKNIIKGDMILSINGISAKSFLESSYHDRYMIGYALQIYHHFNFAENYDLIILRKNKRLEVTIPGMPLTLGNLFKLDGKLEEKIFDNSETGYFNINNFDYNKYLIKRLKRFVSAVKTKGYNNVIIDIRQNPGGNGDRFDELFSLFTNKTKIPYQSGVKLKVSKHTYKDYSYKKEDFGKIVDLPDSLFFREMPLDSSLYIEGINYYVLISRNTASMAATFANIFQYNNMGFLVGEPLAHNALKYGEAVTGERNNSFWSISTVEYLEYTNAENGILKPDIAIPFVASEYMKGGDPVLEHCLELIKAKSKE